EAASTHHCWTKSTTRQTERASASASAHLHNFVSVESQTRSDDSAATPRRIQWIGPHRPVSRQMRFNESHISANHVPIDLEELCNRITDRPLFPVQGCGMTAVENPHEMLQLEDSRKPWNPVAGGVRGTDDVNPLAQMIGRLPASDSVFQHF